MSKRALFIGWDRPTPGKEHKALAEYPKILEYFGSLLAEGRIDSFEPMFLARHGGDLNGIMLIKGDEEKLNELRKDDAWVDMTVACSTYLDSFGVLEAYIGDGFTDIMTRWAKIIAE